QQVAGEAPGGVDVANLLAFGFRGSVDLGRLPSLFGLVVVTLRYRRGVADRPHRDRLGDRGRESGCQRARRRSGLARTKQTGTTGHSRRSAAFSHCWSEITRAGVPPLISSAANCSPGRAAAGGRDVGGEVMRSAVSNRICWSGRGRAPVHTRAAVAVSGRAGRQGRG